MDSDPRVAVRQPGFSTPIATKSTIAEPCEPGRLGPHGKRKVQCFVLFLFVGVGRSVGRSAGRPVGRLVGWLVWLAGWLAG